MRGYNVWRPVMIIATAWLTNSVVINLSVLLGMSPELASNVGFIAMMIAALLMFTRMMKRRHK